ncbi:unnamed protein product, partial [Urochloa humidicola]
SPSSSLPPDTRHLSSSPRLHHVLSLSHLTRYLAAASPRRRLPPPPHGGIRMLVPYPSPCAPSHRPPKWRIRGQARYILTELAAHAVLRLRRTYRAEMGICVGTAAGERVPPTTAASVTSSIDVLI